MLPFTTGFALYVLGPCFAANVGQLDPQVCNFGDQTCEFVSPSLMQIRRGEQSHGRQTSRASAGANTSAQRSLAIFFDGSTNHENKTCNWPSHTDSTRSERLICETNVIKLARLAINDSKQLIYYETGVGTAAGDDYQFGVGTKSHALNGYKWLSANYKNGDAIYVFGYSRGALSARYLQGMIHRVGVAKPNQTLNAIATHTSQDEARCKAFKADADVTFADARIAFMGFWDGVLRTLTHVTQHRNLEDFHLAMTSVVSRFSHAIALDEYREIFQANELVVDPSTEENQVWFMGIHEDVGGGRANTGPTQIPLGWMADEASLAGLLLREGWEADVHVNIDDDTHTETGLATVGDILTNSAKLLEIRNPARCYNDSQVRNARKEGWKLKVHRSVQDRMQLVKGWVPLQWCCAGTRSSINDIGITWTTNPHYEAKRQAEVVGPAEPQWIKVHIGQLRNVRHELALHQVSDWFTKLSFQVKVQSWHTGGWDIPQGARAPSGCCSPQYGGAPEGVHSTMERTSQWWQRPTYKTGVDFTGLVMVLPREAGVADEVIVEVFEVDWVSDDFVGRVKVPYGSTLKQYHSLGNGELEVWIEDVPDDEAVKNLLPGANLPANNDFAQCRWLIQHLGMSQKQVCGVDGYLTDGMLEKMNFANADTCSEFLQDISSGA